MRSVTALVVLAAALLLVPVQQATAVYMTVTYTGDNIIGAWFQNGGAPVPHNTGPNAGNWMKADTATLNLGVGEYQLIFRVQNHGSWATGNPAGFLAEVTGAGVSGDLLTSVNWDWAVAGGANPADFNTLSWASATEYGNNGGSNIWTNTLGGPVQGISTSAKWIWNERNFLQGTDPELYLRGEFTVVPEPGTLALIGIGAGLILALRRRR